MEGRVSRAYLERFNPEQGPRESVRRALEWLNARAIIAPGSRVFIKPNLTWERPTPGVTVTPAFLHALVEALLPITSDITIGESEGGQACFKAEDAFEAHGLFDLAKEFGVKVVNLSTQPAQRVTTIIAGRSVSVDLPRLLLHEIDTFITVPVPKIHAMTRVSLAFKNQWGCLGDLMRVTMHPQFDDAIVAINKLVKTRLAILDGTYFLDYTGPLMGEPVPMNMVIAADSPGAASFVACEVMKVDPWSIAHHRVARREQMFPASMQEIEVNESPAAFAGRQFKLRRAPLNYLHLAAFNNRQLNRLFYNSPFADGLHEVLWFIRRNPLIKRVLYGRFGAGEANRGGRKA